MVAATQIYPGEVASTIVDLLRWRGEKQTSPLVRPTREALADPYLSEIIERYGEDEVHTLGQGTGRNFVFQPGEGLLHFNVQGGLALFLIYCGPRTRYLSTVSSAFTFAQSQGWTPALLVREDNLAGLEPLQLTGTAVGVWQDLVDLEQFSLEGGAMRRLRYCHSRYAALRDAAVIEYRPGTSNSVDERIREMADAWMAAKGVVPGYLRTLCATLGHQPLGRHHRVFLTTSEGKIDNVIVCSSAGVCRGYVLDLELYAPEAPFGHLEYAIVEVAALLRAEGWQHFSLGLTMGASVGQPDNCDPSVVRELERLHRLGAFNGDGNFQFKNKFRPKDRRVLLCGLPGRAPSLIKMVRMLADPYRSPDYERTRETLHQFAARAPAAPVIAPSVWARISRGAA